MTKYMLVLLLILGGCGTFVYTASDPSKSRTISKEKRERRDRSDSSGSCCG
jgi:uncharacterized protein YceK